jgi:energy-coupling factor transporter ATP-binding protein EcfA2
MATTPPTTGIREIEITNFRGIEHLKLDFTDPNGNINDLVVIAGPNGSGKSTVLEACLHLTDHYYRHRIPTWRKDIQFGISTTRATEICGTVVQRNGPCKVDLRHRTHLMKSFGTIGIPADRKPKLTGSVQVALGDHYLEKLDAENDRLQRIKQVLINRKLEELDEPRSFGSNTYSYSKSMELLTRAWSLFVPNHNVKFNITKDPNSRNSGYDLMYTSGSTTHGVDELSSGQLEIVTLLGAILTYPERVQLVIIDEPELHLDAQWHRTMIRALQTVLPGTQLIVATHSDEIYDMAYSWQRHYLLPPGDTRAKTVPEVAGAAA